ncbi:rho GTPase-activating protein gacF-like, partial [Teleopsis dalmanni]|uniref:rho GTPase-activating protein gacF-like n=1 Tax=Teleopsis dalmanni TaxID=139649 RepID=UPI0018CDC0F6
MILIKNFFGSRTDFKKQIPEIPRQPNPKFNEMPAEFSQQQDIHEHVAQQQDSRPSSMEEVQRHRSASPINVTPSPDGKQLLVTPEHAVQEDFNCYDEIQHETTTMSKSNYPTVAVTVEHKKPPLPPPLTQPTSFEVHENSMNIEAVLLQNQVDTLQWQLKQVETSCEMYRAVMEEVVRFLDRYHNHKQNNRNNMEQISRSKSLYHVYAGGHENNPHSDESMATSYLRTRSSTNLIDLKQSPHLLPPPASTHNDAATVANIKHNKLSEPTYDAVAPPNSYSTFKDFTWRRSPKQKQNDNRTHTPALDDVEEKLNQEAFRLSRTIHNLLNTSTQQPVLTQHRNSLSALNLARLNVKTPNGSTLTLHTPTIHNSTSLTLAPNTNDVDTLVNTTVSAIVAPPKAATLANADMLFLRSANIRDSRLSLHSTTDSSVHSTTSSSCTTSSSSKIETDDEPTLPYISGALLCNNNNINKNNKQTLPLCSTTEDESGFSSISSFQEIGVPLCSTPC